jgi:hypothetical protein
MVSQGGRGSFPNELWEMIFDYSDQRDFYRISFVCRRLHQLVEPYLYREFNWIPDPKDPLPALLNVVGDRTTEQRGSKNSPFKLLQTIAKRPELASYFKHAKLLAVSADFGVFWDENEARQNDQPGKKLLSWFLAIHSAPNSNRMKEWTKLFLDGRLDVVVGMVLVQLLHLSSVEIRVRYGSTENNVVFQGLYAAYFENEVYTWRPIKSITISLDNKAERDWTPKQAFINVYNMDTHLPKTLRFPTLQQLSVSHLHNGILAYVLELAESDSCSMAKSLKKLKMTNCMLSEHRLKTLLSYTSCLEELECELQFDVGQIDVCLGDELLEALSEVSKTLRHLKVSLEIRHEFLHPNSGIHTSMGSMKHFKKLRYGPLSYFSLVQAGSKANSVSMSLDIPLILIMPRTEDISHNTIEEVLPDDLDKLIIKRYPIIPDFIRRFQAYNSLYACIEKNPRLHEFRSDHAFDEKVY